LLSVLSFGTCGLFSGSCSVTEVDKLMTCCVFVAPAAIK
jgi:hypothetical protein